MCVCVTAPALQALEYLAGTDVNGFAANVTAVPGLLANAIKELAAMNDQRKSYSVALLQNAML
jgi:hypothetical protein